MTPAKAAFRESREPNSADDVHLTPSQTLGVLPQAEYIAKTGNSVVQNIEGQDSMKHVEPDDFIIHLRSFQGGIERSNYSGKVSTAYTVMQPTSLVVPAYFRWLLKSDAYIQELRTTTNQLRDGQSIKFRDFVKVPLPMPPLGEQRVIADYLDRETARIDTLIEEQHRLIGLLHERRNALIEHSIMTSSDRPIRLSRIATSRSGDVPPPLEADGPFFVWGAGRTVGRTSRANARADDLLVGRVGQGSVGKVRRLTEQAWATDNTIVLRLDPYVADSRYVEYGIRLIPRFELVGGGAMPLVTADRLLAQMVPFTSLEGQQWSADYLDEQTAKIDTLIAETERFIELARERRSALITAAVTGQIDVREAA